MSIWHLVTVMGIVVCAVQAIRTQKMLVSALWLAGTSALTAVLLYLMGAYQVAVIELSVGAGLVTVLFVFAISIAGEEASGLGAVLPRPLAWVLVIAAVVLLGGMILQGFGLPVLEEVSSPFEITTWETRRLDVLLQIVLIFSGVLGVLGLLSEPGSASKKEKSA